jgi:hypothetical protein
MSKFTGIIITLSALLLTGCSGAALRGEPAPLPTVFDGSLEQAQVVMMHDMGAAERFCIERLGKDTPAGYDCYDYAKQVCFDNGDIVNPKEPLRGDCTRRLETLWGK